MRAPRHTTLVHPLSQSTSPSFDLPSSSFTTLGPLDHGPTSRHLTIPPPLPRRIIRRQNSRLTLIRLTECITPLLPHPLHLPDLSNRLLKLFHPRPIILNIIFLNLLHVMIGLRFVHALGIFPGNIARETEDGDDHGHEPEAGVGKGARDDASVLGGEVEEGRDGAVKGDEAKPDDHAARDGKEGPFCPNVSHESGFT
jgi:hypothetical protein